MTRRIRVEVTQEDIDASAANVGACPIERAARRAGYTNAGVGYTVWEPVRRGPPCPLPLDAQRFVTAFDNERPVKPATFLLPLPGDDGMTPWYPEDAPPFTVRDILRAAVAAVATVLIGGAFVWALLALTVVVYAGTR